MPNESEGRLVIIETFKKQGFHYLIYECETCKRKYTVVKPLKMERCVCQLGILEQKK